MGRLQVGEVCSMEEATAKLGLNLWEADDHLIAKPGSPTPMRADVKVPPEVAKHLTFVTRDGTGHLGYPVNAMKLQAIRELDRDSADELDRLFGSERKEAPEDSVRLQLIGESGQELDNLSDRLRKITQVKTLFRSRTQLFTLVFRELLVSDWLRFDRRSRSDWTQSIAFAMRRASDVFLLSCRFEAMGKLDAVIEGRHQERSHVVLLAEWEWDCWSVFGESQELEKLWNGVAEQDAADALLFTYCPSHRYHDLVADVVKFCQNRAAKNQGSSPVLYLMVAVYEKSASVETMVRFIRSVEVHAREIRVWRDRALDVG
jgi:hypothetical protein